MLPDTEHNDNGHSSEKSDEQIAALKPPTQPPARELAQHTKVATGNNVANQGGAIVADEDSDSSSTNIFSDPVVAAHYIGVYDRAQYECRHAFDPDVYWTKREEKGVIRKLDWHGKIHRFTKTKLPTIFAQKAT